MALATFDDVIAGGLAPSYLRKALTGTLVAGREYTPIYANGIPGAATANATGLSGAALTSYAGLFPFTNPGGGDLSYIARLTGYNSAQNGQWLLMDRLWHNSGITITSTGSQTITSAAWPARDNNGATDGVGVIVALEVSANVGAGTPTLTLGYTNSAGTAGRTATSILATAASPLAGSMYFFALQAGDVGVRSIQTYQQSATWTSGTVHLVAFRPLASIDVGTAGGSAGPLECGMPRLYDNTCIQPIFLPSTTTTGLLSGMLSLVQA
jgi:hypothetical protein